MPTHVVAVAVIVDDSRALLAHRHPGREWYPDCWDLVGGHIEPDEAPLAALRRECVEEVGIVVRGAEPVAMPSTDPDVEIHAFIVRDWLGTPTNLAPDEHDDLRWFRPDELRHLRLAEPAIVPVVEAALRGPGTPSRPTADPAPPSSAGRAAPPSGRT